MSVPGGGATWPCGAGPPGAGGPRRNWAEFCGEKILDEISGRGRGADSSQRHLERTRFSFVDLPFSPIAPRISGRFHRLPKTARNCLPVPQAFTQPPSIQGFLLNPHILSILHRCSTYQSKNVDFMSFSNSLYYYFALIMFFIVSGSSSGFPSATRHQSSVTCWSPITELP